VPRAYRQAVGTTTSTVRIAPNIRCLLGRLCCHLLRKLTCVGIRDAGAIGRSEKQKSRHYGCSHENPCKEPQDIKPGSTMDQPSPDEHQIDRRKAEEHLGKNALLPRMNEGFPRNHFRCLTALNIRNQSISHEHANSDHYSETKAEKSSKDRSQDPFHSGERKLPQLSAQDLCRICMAQS
jgi:hypothetical protein